MWFEPKSFLESPSWRLGWFFRNEPVNWFLLLWWLWFGLLFRVLNPPYCMVFNVPWAKLFGDWFSLLIWGREDSLDWEAVFFKPLSFELRLRRYIRKICLVKNYKLPLNRHIFDSSRIINGWANITFLTHIFYDIFPYVLSIDKIISLYLSSIYNFRKKPYLIPFNITSSPEKWTE